MIIKEGKEEKKTFYCNTPGDLALNSLHEVHSARLCKGEKKWQNGEKGFAGR